MRYTKSGPTAGCGKVPRGPPRRQEAPKTTEAQLCVLANSSWWTVWVIQRGSSGATNSCRFSWRFSCVGIRSANSNWLSSSPSSPRRGRSELHVGVGDHLRGRAPKRPSDGHRRPQLQVTRAYALGHAYTHLARGRGPGKGTLRAAPPGSRPHMEKDVPALLRSLASEAIFRRGLLDGSVDWATLPVLPSRCRGCFL